MDEFDPLADLDFEPGSTTNGTPCPDCGEVHSLGSFLDHFLDQQVRAQVVRQLAGAVFACMEEERLPLNAAIAVVRDQWQAHQREDGPPSVDMTEFSNEVWAEGSYIAVQSFERMARLIELGRN